MTFPPSQEPENQAPENVIPMFLRKTVPLLSDLFVIDARIPAIELMRVLAGAGFYITNLKDGRLAITKTPEDFR